MKVKVGIYETPAPAGRPGKSMCHARISSKGTVRTENICSELLEIGLNSAQIKGVVDGLARYIGKTLMQGYHVELEGIGTFSLSVRSCVDSDDPDEEKVRFFIDGVNFKCSRKLKKMVEQTDLVVGTAERKSVPPADSRRKNMLDYLRKNEYINASVYARINDCSRYLSRRDLQAYLEEGLLISRGKSTHKVYFPAR